ncbi:MAG: Pycsar system effector family protein [Fidelibacterota bacterium]
MTTDSENRPLSDDINPLLRTTQQYHFQLSVMADQKANIIAATSILFTISLTNFKMEEMLWGFVCLAAFSLIALIFAIMAVYPSYEAKKGERSIDNVNPLFFGHFTRFTPDEYYDMMDKVFDSSRSIYRAQLKNLYQLGVVLKNRKYKFLKYSYQFFFVGLISSVILFTIQLLRILG